mmetsp:Transcript_23090/g.32210  ORF Transcript_23090/g.32210 Transcript_23090/m.32210 type:complete len:137 (+) Transcript_23090:70-480(+)
MESWEEYDALKEEEWPDLINSASKPNKKQSNQAQSKGFDLKSAHPYFESQPAVKILTRKNAQNESSTVPAPKIDTSTTTTEAKQKTLEQREQEYLEARRRILGNSESENNNKTQSPTIANKPKQGKSGRGKTQQSS